MTDLADWRAVLDRRVAEAFARLGTVPGVSGLILAGSVGRGTAWPLSDIDLVVVHADAELPAEFERRRGLMEDFWSWAQVPGSLDAGTLAFSVEEVTAVVDAPLSTLVDRLADRRWFHAIDKAYGGQAAPGSAQLVAAFATLLTAARFRPEVVQARLAYWRADADTAVATARDRLACGDRPGAALALTQAVESTIEVLTERWGERSGSLGRRWSRFERLARRHDAVTLAGRLLALSGVRPRDIRPRLAVAPWWLHRRISTALAARRLVGEPVSAEENARDQLLAFAHLWRRREMPAQLWSEPRVRPDLAAALDDLDALLVEAG